MVTIYRSFRYRSNADIEIICLLIVGYINGISDRSAKNDLKSTQIFKFSKRATTRIQQVVFIYYK